jgi:hypothetical protein
VPFGDGHALLSGKAGDERELLFPRTGRHWSLYGACVVFREALRGTAAEPSCAYDMLETNREHGGEFDLYRLQNLWRFEHDPPRVPITRPQRRAEGATTPLPRALFAGTSFTWIFVDELAPLVAAPLALRYNTTFEQVGAERRVLGPADVDSPRWTERVLGRDLYVFEIFEALVDLDYNLDFATALDARLD